MSDNELEKSEDQTVVDAKTPLDDLVEKNKTPLLKGKPVKQYYSSNPKKLSPMVADFMLEVGKMVIGQELAKKELASVLTSTLAYNPNRKSPIAALFLPGPTGVGKTQIARAMFRVMYGDPHIDFDECKIDCNLFTNSHESARLKGAPPGYKGYGDKALLHPDFVFSHTNAAIKRNSLHPLFKNIVNYDRTHLPSIILLDEFEKADPDFFKMFYGIFDNGNMILMDGTKVDFRNTIFIMTSNIGSSDIQSMMEGTGTVGMIQDTVNISKAFKPSFYKKKIKETGIFTAEFVNRIDIIPFKPLTRGQFLERIHLSLLNHNELFKDTGIRLHLTKKLKNYLVDLAFDSNEGGRRLVKTFNSEIVTLFTRLRFNGEVDEREEKTGYKVVEIKVTVTKKGKFKTQLGISQNIKALNREQKYKKDLEKRKTNLDQQEAIVSLKEKSMLITQRDVMLPNLKYYAALLTHRDTLDVNFEEELKNTETVLITFGYQSKDFELLKYQILENKYNQYEESYNELHLESSSVRLWNDDDKIHAFNGMIRYVEKYMRKYFETNKDVKAMIKAGAGTKQDIIQPIVEYASKLVNRDLSDSEMTIILVVLHREYSKLHATIPPEKQIAHKKADSTKTKKDVAAKEKVVEQKGVVININFLNNFNETSTKQKLENLFQDKFDKVILAITQNVASRKEKDDIIDIMNNIKIELEQQFDLNSTQTTTIMQVVQDILKEEELLKK